MGTPADLTGTGPEHEGHRGLPVTPPISAGAANDEASTTRRRPGWQARLRFVLSWVAAVALVAAVLPSAVSVSWHGIWPVLGSVHWPAALGLAVVWLLGLYVHSFVLTAAAPGLTHRRALTLNLTGSAVANLVPLGGAAGVELNRRMMQTWGIDGRAFTGYTFLTNLWDVGSKLLLPIVAVAALINAGETITSSVRTATTIAAVAFVALISAAAYVLCSDRGAAATGRHLEAWARRGLRLLGRADRELGLAEALVDVRAQSAGLVRRGWLRMSAAMAAYVFLQAVLLALCLELTGATSTWPEVLAAFAVERLLTVVPLTPGGVGVADLGLVGVLLALGGDPVGVTAAAVLYRAFVFLVEIPVGSGALGAWLLTERIRGLARVPS